MSRAGIAALSKERETVLSKHPEGSKNQENSCGMVFVSTYMVL